MPKEKPRRGNGPAPLLDPASKALILEEVERGHSYAHIQRELKSVGIDVAISTLAKYVKQARAEARRKRLESGEEEEQAPAGASAGQLLRERAAEREARPPVELPMPPEGATLRQQLEAQLAGVMKAQTEAYASGDLAVSARYAKAATELTNQLMRLQKQERDSATGTILSAEDLAAAEQKIRDTVRAALERPLLCAHCSRLLSVDWGGVPLSDEPQAAE